MKRYLVVPIASLLCFAGVLMAQGTTAQISGQVLDPSGAPVARATVAVTNINTQVQQKTSTNDLGNYAVPLLPPGDYRIDVTVAGFRPIARSGVTLQVAQVARLDFTLPVEGQLFSQEQVFGNQGGAGTE